MTTISSLVRKHIRDLVPYSSARDEFTGSAEIYLDANENSIGSVLKEGLNRYPDPLQKQLKQIISQTKNIASNRIFIGNGSDEAIDLLIRAFCEPGVEKMIVMPPTYGMYAVSAAINNVESVEIPLTTEFNIELPAVLSHLDEKIKLIFICSPNNPTANLMKREAIESILNSARGLVIIDEAYIDFSDSDSLIPWLKRYNNLVILQTFSKAWGLANIRLGIALANPDVVDVLNRIKPPYNVSGVTQQAVIDSLAKAGLVNRMVEEIKSQKIRLVNALNSLNCVEKVFPSDANFILVRFIDAIRIFKALINSGIIVRDRTKALNCENCLRITVGKPTENKKLIDLLKKLDHVQ